MNDKKKKICYGILAGLTVVLCLSLSIFFKVRERRFIKEAIIEDKEVISITPTIEVTKIPKATPKVEGIQENIEEGGENREVRMNAEEYENERLALQKELEESRPEFLGITLQIEEGFLRNDLDVFWEALGIYIVSTFGSQKGKVVEFINMIDQGDRVNCTMKVADSEGEQLFLLGSYNITSKYYEFTIAPDVYTYDDTIETGEGGL